jgi:hypothetical protein
MSILSVDRPLHSLPAVAGAMLNKCGFAAHFNIEVAAATTARSTNDTK